MNLGANIKKSFIHVQHSDLKRFTEDSAYRSYCPICEAGVLLVHRDPKTFALARWDRCTFCGQGFIYDDEVVGGEALEPLPSDFEERIKAALNVAIELSEFGLDVSN
jgi:hypothetical protein